MTYLNNHSSLFKALKHLEVAEANLVKLENLWSEINQMIPDGPAFGSPPDYNEKCQAYKIILPYLNKIDGWRPATQPEDYDTIGQWRIDALELDEISATVAIESEIKKPGEELRQYRFLLNQKRRQVTRQEMFRLIALVDNVINEMNEELIENDNNGIVRDLSKEKWKKLDDYIGQIDVLLGSTNRPPRWVDLMRHKRFAQSHDAIDIRDTDWPIIKEAINLAIYEGDPIPAEIDDLNSLLALNITGHITKQLNWANISAEQFERLIYVLFLSTEGYENPQWLMQTNAPDRGRDLSVDRIINDTLGGITRKRILVQCKHWLNKSVSVTDIATLEAQLKLWEPPRIDVCIIATTGRFTADAVAFFEKENQSNKALTIEMWPESHLESILAKRPDLIADFSLR